MDIKIRKGNQSDIETIMGFQLDMALETENLVLDEQTVTKGVSAVIEDPSKGQYFLAVVDGKVVGSLMVTIEWSDWRNNKIYWIQSVFVKKEFRTMGIFKQLYLHIKNQVENDESLGGIRLYVDNTNLKAKQVYDRLGMNGDHYSVFEWMKAH